MINQDWIFYLKSNSKIIKDFCYWNLSLFLQRRNPNVPDIPNKLVKSPNRSGLQKQTKEYWQLVFNELGGIDCIFTGNRLTLSEKNFAIDHFVPYAFVSHDLIWNLIPIDKSFNSKKSDKLPSFETYFKQFQAIQKLAFEIHINTASKSKYLEEYLTIFPNLNSFNEDSFKNTIQLLLAIASNNGFLYLQD